MRKYSSRLFKIVSKSTLIILLQNTMHGAQATCHEHADPHLKSDFTDISVATVLEWFYKDLDPGWRLLCQLILKCGVVSELFHTRGRLCSTLSRNGTYVACLAPGGGARATEQSENMLVLFKSWHQCQEFSYGASSVRLIPELVMLCDMTQQLW